MNELFPKLRHALKLTLVAVGLSLVCLVLFMARPVDAHCTGYHPHHCKPKDLDPFNKNSGIRKSTQKAEKDIRRELSELDRKRLALMHLGGQACRARAISVSGTNRSRVGLTAEQKKYLRPHFGHLIDLDKIRVNWGAKLNSELKVGSYTVWVAADAQTFGYLIFFRERLKPGDPRQLLDLAHELQHVVQYKKAGSLTRFCQRYMDGYTNGPGYYGNPMEREAYNVEFRIAHWLRKNVDSPDGMIAKYVHGMPNNSRSVWIPNRLR